MEQEKILSLLSRQLRDIQSQADKILRDDNSAEAIESFARYSQELKHFIMTKVEDPEVLRVAAEIPVVNYKRNRISLWQFLILPAWWISLYKDYQQRQVSLEEISSAKGKYASLELLVNSVA